MKSKKSALLLSFTSLLLCFAMLAGSTFAWFTDTASTGVNQIVSGKLDVALEMKNPDYDPEVEGSKEWINAEGKTLEFVKAAGAAENEAVLWEPNCTYKLPELRVVNKGNLALKWKVEVNKGTTAANEKNADLLDVIDFYLVTKASDGTETEALLDKFTGNLKKSETSDVYYIKGHMQEKADNKYQNLTLEGISITVYATQDTVEYDSFNNQYDKDAPVLYPAGVTTDSFPATADYTNDQGQIKSDAPATVAYVDENGVTKYAADLNTAIGNGASVIYCKEDAKLVGSLTRGNSRTGELTSDLTIYANDADFQNTEISINNTSLDTESVGKTKNFTLRVNDAKNIRIWGNTPDAGVTQNIILENCTYEGTGIGTNAAGGIFFAYGETGTINLTMNNCKVSGSDQGVYFGCDGSLTVKDSSFTECATGIKVSYKGAGTRTDRIENCVFTKCGCTTAMAGTSSYLAEDSAAFKYKKNTEGGQITLTLKNNKITGTIGDKGDMQFIGVTPVNE